MSRLSLFTLGQPRIELGDVPIKLQSRKTIALLVYLAVTGERHNRDSLVGLLWPDSNQSRARTTLRHNLYILNKTLGANWLDVDRETVGLNPDSDTYLDAGHFLNLLSQCRTHDHPRDQICPDCTILLTQAVELYRDDFLKGFSLKDSINFDDWQFFESQILHRELTGALERLVQCLSLKGEYRSAVSHAQRWLALDPLHEPAHCQLIKLYAWAEERSRALGQYEECVKTLREQVDAAPLETTTELYQAIKEGRAPIPPLFHEPMPSDEVLKTPSTLAEEDLPKTQTLADFPEEENRIVTLLYVNIQPGDNGSPIAGFLKMIEDVLTKYGGKVDRFIGESVLALFGGEGVHENDPELAIRAAIEIRGEARKMGLRVKLGANTGGVYFTKMESKESTLMGEVVKLALGLTSKTEGGEILVGESTYRHTRRAFEFKQLSLEIRGIEGPVTAYKVERLLPEPKKARGLEGLRSELIGRDEELSKLRDVLDGVLEGRSQMVSIIGEVGLGKSRLVTELKEYIGSESQKKNPKPQISSSYSTIHNPQSEILWLEGRCLELGTMASYWPFIDIFREYFRWSSEEGNSERAQSIISSLGDMVDRADLSQERSSEIGPLVGNLLSVQFGDEWDEELKGVSPKEIQLQTFRAVGDFFLALGRRMPLILVFEDLHWADSHSLDLISLLMEGLEQGSLLLLCVYRPEREHKCWNLATIARRKCPERYTELHLRELTPHESSRLVESLLRTESLPSSVKELILAKSQGNPFFVEEVIRSLVHRNIVYQEDESWKAQEEIADLDVPDMIQSVVMARVDTLHPEAKCILQFASVIGRLFNYRLLKHLAQGEENLDHYLREFKEKDLVYEERTMPELEYAFKHVLTQEAIYQSIIDRRKRGFHQQVAEGFEILYGEGLGEHYEQLAYHYSKSDDLEKARDYLVRAGDKAAAAYANKEALDYYAKALEVCGLLGDPALATSVDVAKRRGNLNFSIDDVPGAIADFNRMLVAARNLGNRRLEGMALTLRGNSELKNNDLEAAEETLRAALDVAGERFKDVRFFASAILGKTLLCFNRHDEVKPLLQVAEELVPEVDDPFIQRWWIGFACGLPLWEGRFDDALKYLTPEPGVTEKSGGGGIPIGPQLWEAIARGGKGDYERALAVLKDFLTVAGRSGNLEYRARALNTVGWVYAEIEDHQRAMEWNSRGVEAARRIDALNPEVECNAILNLGDNLMVLNRLDEAEEQFEKVEKIVRNPRPQDHYMLWRYSQHLFHSYGELWLMRGDYDKALAYADECLDLAEESNSRKNIVKGRRLQGQALLARGKPAQAEGEVLTALKVAKQVGNPPQLWKTYTALGDLRKAQERAEEARRAYRNALAVIEEVASGLKDESLRETFFNSDYVGRIRQAVGSMFAK